MPNFLETLRAQGNAMPAFLEENKARRERWAYLSEGLDDMKRLTLEAMLDNTNMLAMQETTSSGVAQSSAAVNILLPLVRKVFPNLIANDLVSVQPIQLPTALIFYLDFVYQGILAGTVPQNNDSSYSAFNGSALGTNMQTLSGFNPYYAGGKIKGLYVGEGDGSDQTFDLPAYARSFVTDSDHVYVDGVEVTAYTYSSPTITFTTAPADGAVITFDCELKPVEGGQIPEIGMEITSKSVTAESKRLQARWTLEAQQDLLAYHGLNAENELLTMMASEVRREIDRGIINDIYFNCTAGNVTWSKTAPDTFDGSSQEWRATLLEAIIDANQLVYDKRAKNANWIVAAPDVCTLIEKLAIYAGITFRGEALSPEAGQNVEKFGVLNNRFTVYKDPMMTAGKALVGYKGTSLYDAGYVYAPYIPLYVSPTIIDPNTLKSNKAVMSRFAKEIIAPDAFATLTVTA